MARATIANGHMCATDAGAAEDSRTGRAVRTGRIRAAVIAPLAPYTVAIQLSLMREGCLVHARSFLVGTSDKRGYVKKNRLRIRVFAHSYRQNVSNSLHKPA